MANVVVGVLGGSGGVGASTFAANLAAAAPPSTLIDLDPVGGGLDVLLGIETLPGARWSGLRLEGGRLDPALLAERLPRWGSVAVLAADVAPTWAAAEQVVEAAAELGPVIIDLPRSPSRVRDRMVQQCDMCVLVVAAELRELTAARALLRSLPNCRVGAMVRRGSLAVGDAAGLIGVQLLGVLPALDRSSGVPRATARVTSGVLDGLASAGRLARSAT